MSNRRQFIAAAAAGPALVTVGAPAFAAAQRGAARRLGGSPTLAAFESLQGQDFSARLDGGESVCLHLQAVKPHAGRQALEQFSLVLRGSARQPLEGGVYQLEHAQSGPFQLRLDPSGSGAQGQLYRADLSLLV